ncbi:MAG: hypothetical protein ABSD48_16475 [Armatimonadota bacterium]|jgi:hypothetical protein
MTKPEKRPDVDLVGAVRRSRRDMPTVEGTNAHLTVATLLCGFAFAGLILYLGTGRPHATHVVAASLLAAAFIVLLYAALSIASLVETSGSERRLLTRVIYWIESGRSLFLGLALLLASVCVMSFTWSTPLGCVVVPLSALFIARCAWLIRRVVRLDRVTAAVDAHVIMIDTLEEALGADAESGIIDLCIGNGTVKRPRRLIKSAILASGLFLSFGKDQ